MGGLTRAAELSSNLIMNELQNRELRYVHAPLRTTFPRHKAEHIIKSSRGEGLSVASRNQRSILDTNPEGVDSDKSHKTSMLLSSPLVSTTAFRTAALQMSNVVDHRFESPSEASAQCGGAWPYSTKSRRVVKQDCPLCSSGKVIPRARARRTSTTSIVRDSKSSHTSSKASTSHPHSALRVWGFSKRGPDEVGNGGRNAYRGMTSEGNASGPKSTCSDSESHCICVYQAGKKQRRTHGCL